MNWCRLWKYPGKEKNDLNHKFSKFLTKGIKEYTYKELAAKFKFNSELARTICIKLFNEGKI